MDNLFQRLRKPKDIPSLYPDLNLTESSILKLAHNCMANGFESCIHTGTGELLIKLDAFEKWLHNQSLKCDNG